MSGNKLSLEQSSLNIPVPPIVYSTAKSGVGSLTQGQENDVSPLSSFDQWMKSFIPSVLSPSTESDSVSASSLKKTVHEKTAFIVNNRGEFSAVPYDSDKNKDFVEITGKNASEGGRLYAPTIKSPKRKPNTDNADEANTLDKPRMKDTDDYIFHMYVGSLSIIGLLILFRMIQKS